MINDTNSPHFQFEKSFDYPFFLNDITKWRDYKKKIMPMLLDIVKRNMIYKNLETVSDLIQRNEKRDNKQKKLFFTDISKQRFIVFRYSNLLLMKQQLSFYNP